MKCVFAHGSKATAPSIYCLGRKIVFKGSLLETEDKDLILGLLAHPSYDGPNPFFAFRLLYQTRSEVELELAGEKVETKTEAVVTPSAEPAPEYKKMSRNELMRRCEKRGLEPRGNKDDLIARLVMNDLKNSTNA